MGDPTGSLGDPLGSLGDPRGTPGGSSGGWALQGSCGVCVWGDFYIYICIDCVGPPVRIHHPTPFKSMDMLGFRHGFFGHLEFAESARPKRALLQVQSRSGVREPCMGG